MTLDRAEIERVVPHAGDMCLLDAVRQWDATAIECIAASPNAAHPLARRGALAAVNAAEYAAQAAAVHGALLDGRPAPAAVLAKLSNVELYVKQIPLNEGAFAVHARLLGRGEGGCIYDFRVDCANHPIARGRLMVAFKLYST